MAYQQTIEERIKMLRLNMVVHSYIYYVLNENIISDHQWQAMADELVFLQSENPELQIGCYDEEFKNWDGSTGYHLPRDNWASYKARYLLDYHDRYKKGLITNKE